MTDPSPSPGTLVVENLLVAALLIVGGARLVKVDVGERISSVYLDMSRYNPPRLSGDFAEFSEVVSDLGADLEINTLNSAYSAGVMGRVEQQYRMLKRQITRKRQGRR